MRSGKCRRNRSNDSLVHHDRWKLLLPSGTLGQLKTGHNSVLSDSEQLAR